MCPICILACLPCSHVPRISVTHSVVWIVRFDLIRFDSIYPCIDSKRVYESLPNWLIVIWIVRIIWFTRSLKKHVITYFFSFFRLREGSIHYLKGPKPFLKSYFGFSSLFIIQNPTLDIVKVAWHSGDSTQQEQQISLIRLLVFSQLIWYP